jgi:hypothetical protein
LGHDREPTDAGSALQSVQHDPRRDVVGKVPDQRVPAEGGELGVERVRVANGHVGDIPDDLLEDGHEGAIDFEGDHSLRHRREAQRQGTGPRADLDHRIGGGHVRQRHDLANGVGIDDEVLA